MTDTWFTQTGATGDLEIERRSDGWYVVSASADRDTRCVLSDESVLDGSKRHHRVTGTVTSFRWGTGSAENFLHFSPNGGPANEKRATPIGASARKPDTERLASQDDREQWQLRDFEGTGEFVDVEARVENVYMLTKNKPDMPDLKGSLSDDSVDPVLNPVYFVVDAGVSHPYFEEKTWFRFENVKDHYYEHGKQVQVLVTEDTTITRL